MDDVITVGISEILKTNIKLRNIDCVVGVCDWAGKLIMTNLRVVQGVGAGVSGPVSTTPIPEGIEKLCQKGSVILDCGTAKLNQLDGLKMNLDMGYKNIEVTFLPSLYG